MSFQKVRDLSSKVDAGLSSCFEKLGTVVVKRPCLVILSTTVLAFAFFPGMMIGGAQNDGEKLWTPQDTESQDQGEWVMATFGASDRRARVYSINNKANVLTHDSLMGLENLHDGMMAVTAKCE